MITIQLSNFNKTLKIIDLKTKQPQPSIKNHFVFQNKINNTKSPLKGGNQNIYIYLFIYLKTMKNINREFSGLASHSRLC
jgi:hypothetical protein